MDLGLAVSETSSARQAMQIATIRVLLSLPRRKRLLQLLQLLSRVFTGSTL